MATVTKNRNFFKWLNFSCGGLLGQSSEMPDTNLEEDHPRIISAKFG
jgi:hypothetical protein